MNARYFDVNNYLITAADIRGPWSEPVYLHSSGFDASILHDNGKKYIVSLEWETRGGYEKPGAICMVEYDPEKKKLSVIPNASGTAERIGAALKHPIYTNGENIITSCVQKGELAIIIV